MYSATCLTTVFRLICRYGEDAGRLGWTWVLGGREVIAMRALLSHSTLSCAAKGRSDMGVDASWWPFTWWNCVGKGRRLHVCRISA